MYFIGVSTGESSIVGLFPRWARILGIDAELVGIDIPIGSPPHALRDAVRRILDDPEGRGGLVTTHKVAIWRHAGDLFAEVDPWAEACGEVSCLAVRDRRLLGWAKDPITSWRSLVEIAGDDHFGAHPDATVLCLGAGGAGTAVTSRLLTVDHPPGRVVLTDASSERLAAVGEIHRRLGAVAPVEYRSAADADVLLSGLPPHSVVVNATGLGKDRPGSPLSDDTAFPEHGIAWELNYRGSLEFLAQARRQAVDRRLVVADGWRYFLHGWTDHVAEVFQLDLDAATTDRLHTDAERLRPR